MGCFKTLTLNEAPAEGDTPLFSAVYVPSTNKILGTMENYICEFDADTGAFGRAVKFISPMVGPAWIGLVNGLPWVSYRMELANMNLDHAVQTRRDIFKVNTATLEQDGLPVGIPGETLKLSYKNYDGPLSLFGIGNLLIFIFQNANFHQANFVDTTNFSIYGGSTVLDFGWWTEHGCTDGTDAYFAAGGFNAIRHLDGSNLNEIEYSDTGSYVPCSVAWVSGAVNKPYAICTDGTMIRVDVFASSTNTVWDLRTLASLPNAKPIRIRYSAVDKNLYIPCQSEDSIIVFDTVAETVTVKTGFDSPIDIVSTPTKNFAVQSGLLGLKEIV